jgi:hypothetical protein
MSNVIVKLLKKRDKIQNELDKLRGDSPTYPLSLLATRLWMQMGKINVQLRIEDCRIQMDKVEDIDVLGMPPLQAVCMEDMKSTNELSPRASSLRDRRWELTMRRLIGTEVTVREQGRYYGKTGILVSVEQGSCKVELAKKGIQEFSDYLVTSAEPTLFQRIA